MEAILHLLQKAEQCRRLSLSIGNRRDPAIKRLIQRAEEIEADVAAILALRGRQSVAAAD